ncbi:hypothetical protein PoB_006134500 [Plakobranchus ocellatus]|uniref:Secreted protein n=1 Tax=Plakobranchus ocellatus TaxID=259542 RepID=A0AAV4CSK9_9GAST|nr:hypothetical protein PoB_006134500 [Plakobranchus ocellatus]
MCLAFPMVCVCCKRLSRCVLPFQWSPSAARGSHGVSCLSNGLRLLQEALTVCLAFPMVSVCCKRLSRCDVRGLTLCPLSRSIPLTSGFLTVSLEGLTEMSRVSGHCGESSDLVFHTRAQQQACTDIRFRD